MRTYPDIPINIEIKGTGDSDVDSFLHNAELLAAELKRIGRTEGIIVASFNDLALQHFHELAPEIGLAPATGAVAAWKLANAPLPEGVVAFQVPITFGGVSVTDAEFVQRAHAQGYAVHVWLSGQREAPDVYEQLLEWNVDGVMAAEPTSLERVLCMRNVVRPVTPGVTHCPAAALACRAEPGRLSRTRRRGVVRLRIRRSDTVGACRGVARLRGGRARRFVINEGKKATTVRLETPAPQAPGAWQAAAAVRVLTPRARASIPTDGTVPPSARSLALRAPGRKKSPIALRQPGALPGQRRLALILDHEFSSLKPFGVLLARRAKGWRGSASSRVPTTSVGTIEALKALEPVEGARAGHHPQGVGHGLKVAIAPHALPGRQCGRLAPALG